MKRILSVFSILFILLILFSCSKTAPKKTAKIETSVNYEEMADVPGGSYSQSDGISSFIHEIQPFKTGKYEVTYELWYKVYKWASANGYAFSGAGAEGHNGSPGAVPTAAKHEPVTQVSWRDVIVWCNAYSRMNNLKPVYYSDTALTSEIMDSRDEAHDIKVNRQPGSCDNPYADWSADGYRLPTEGEWQYAAGYIGPQNFSHYKYPAGSSADFDDPFLTDQAAWYYANSEFGTKDAGTKNPNKLGIYDMSGNVFEWCWDWYGKYPSQPQSSYKGPAAGLSRVRKGGAYHSYAHHIAIGCRFSYYPYHGDKGTGFRIARNNQVTNKLLTNK